MTDISMRIAEIIDEAAHLPLLCGLLSTMNGLEVFDKITSATAKDMGTF